MTRLMTRITLSLFLALLVALRVDASQLLQGATANGALYAIAVPDVWNGDLVVYGHGIVDPAAPIALPSSQDNFDALKEALLQRGFAVAYSSYAENGYALEDAAQQLHHLSGVLETNVVQRSPALAALAVVTGISAAVTGVCIATRRTISWARACLAAVAREHVSLLSVACVSWSHGRRGARRPRAGRAGGRQRVRAPAHCPWAHRGVCRS